MFGGSSKPYSPEIMMPVVFQRWISREDCHRQPKALFLFGDNEQQRGLGGQAKEMRGCPNARGIPTKAAPGRNDRDFWSETDLGRVVPLIDAAFAPALDHALAGGTIIVPADGLGTGLSELSQRAPSILRYIEDWVMVLRAGGDVRRLA